MTTKNDVTGGLAVWAGTENSFHLAMQRAVKDNASHGMQALHTALQARHDHMGQDEDPLAEYGWMISQFGAVAVITISGSLDANEGNWDWYYGWSSYQALRNALSLVESTKEKTGVKSVILHVNSSGGTAEAVFDTADFIRAFDKNVMPVVTVATGQMCSAALLLGTAAGKVFASPMADVGSIGVITIHVEYSKMFEEFGIKYTVLRAGENKALATPYEPLSDKARAALEEKAEALNDAFVAYLSKFTGTAEADIRKKWGQGKVFFGVEAKKLGMIDDTKTLDEVVKMMQERHTTAASNANYLSMEESAMSKEKLENKPEDALAAVVAADPGKEASPAAPAALSEQPAPAAPVAASADIVALANDLVTAKTSLAAAQAETTALKGEKEALETQLAASRAEQTELAGIVAAMTNRLEISLGGHASDLKDAPASKLAATFHRLSTEFNKKFPAGGRSVAPMGNEAHEANQGPAPVSAAALHAVRAK